MASFDGESLFTGSVSVIAVGPWANERKVTGFPGVDGVLEIRLGLRGRPIRQSLTLCRTGVSALAELVAAIAAIEAYVGAGAYTLVDDFGRTFTDVSMQAAAAGPIIRGGASGLTYACTMQIDYLQLT